MARTTKDEHKTDGWNIWLRLQRQARPAGRKALAFWQDFELDFDNATWTAI